MEERPQDRRRYGRIELDTPIEAMIDDVPVDVIEVSVVGVRIEHEMRFAPGHPGTIKFTWKGRELQFTCNVIRSTLFRLAKMAGDRTIYHSGVNIVTATGDSEQTLRDLIAERVIRALDEQKANARGIPPIHGYTYRVGKGNRFRRCEFDGENWRRFETTKPDQPSNGFTVSAEIEPHHLDMLTETYASTTPEGRRLTQLLAQLSINKSEGTATRRYVP